MTAMKRLDIQGLRCVAIVSVILFHLLPASFHNGFLGVDVFFVLSGYLMALILGRESRISLMVMVDFYKRRLRRIVPLYSIVLLGAAMVTPFIFLPDAVKHFEKSLSRALLFTSNIANGEEKKDYWSEAILVFHVFSYPVLLHTWSLGVEMQYYVMVPIAYYFIITNIPSPRTRIFLQAVMGITSFLYCLQSPEDVAFNSVFARAWQFIVGSTAQLASSTAKDDISIVTQCDTDPSSKASNGAMRGISYGSLILLLVLVLTPTVSKLFLRISVTLLTALLLHVGNSFQNRLLSNRIAVFMGDLSYVLYLVHWPVIVLYKYHRDLYELDLNGVFACFALSLSLSLVLHFFVEKPLLRWPTLFSLLVVSAAYGIMIALLMRKDLGRISQMRIDGISNGTLRHAVDAYFNHQFFDSFTPLRGCKRDIEGEEWTGTPPHQGRGIFHGSGRLKILLIGNSWAFRAFPTLLTILRGRFKELRMFTQYGQGGFFLTPTSNKEYRRAVEVILERMNPYITLFIAHNADRSMFRNLSLPIENDPLVRFAQGQVDLLSNHSRFVVVDYQYFIPHVKGGTAYRIARRILNGQMHFEDLSTNYQNYRDEYRFERARMDALSAPNLIKNRVADQLCTIGENVCRFYNTSTLRSYYSDEWGHLNIDGLHRLEPGYRLILEGLIRKLMNLSG